MKSRTHRTRALPALLLSTLGGLALVGVPAQNAQAQVIIASCMAVPGIPCASMLDVNGTTTAVTAVGTTVGYTHTYLTTGVGGSTGGVVALLGGINERLGMVTNANDESVENSDLAARQRIYDERMMDVRGSRLPTPSAVRRACVQATAATGGAGAARGSGGAGRAASERAMDRYNDNRPAIQAMADSAVNRKDLGTCSAEDVKFKRAGCHNAGVGDRPNADLRLRTLYDGGKPDAPNVSVDERGFKIGEQLIANVMPTPADPIIREAERTSQPGVLYTLRSNLYTSRAATAADAMGQILGFSTALNVPDASMGSETAKPFLLTWPSYKQDYEKMFGAGSFPAIPSEREMIRFAAMRYYANPEELTKLASLTEREIAVRQTEILAVNGYMAYLTIERLERQNALLSALLAHEMDPITSDGLRNLRSSIGGGTGIQN